MNTPMISEEPAMLEPAFEVPMETNHEVVDDYIYLIGRPTLRQFLSFVRNRSRDGRRADAGALTDEWRAAASHIGKLERSEADCADHPVLQPLPAHLEPLQEQFTGNPLVQRGSSTSSSAACAWSSPAIHRPSSLASSRFSRSGRPSNARGRRTIMDRSSPA